MANPRNMRVQVERSALIAAIERKAAQCKKDYERQGPKLITDIRKWRDGEVKDIRDEIKRLQERAAQLSKLSPEKIQELVKKSGSAARPYFYLESKSFYPPQPREGNQLTGFDTILRMLRMSKKDSVSLSEEQFRAYMDGCPVSR